MPPNDVVSYANLRHRQGGDPPARPPRRSLAKFSVWKWLAPISLGGILVVGVPGVVVAATEGRVGAVIAWQWIPLLLLLMFTAAAMLLRNWRRRDAAATLFYLAEAVRLNLPLPPFLTAAANSERGRLGWRLRKLAQFLAIGDSVAAALRAAEPATPPRTLAFIDAAEQSGQLSATLSRLAAQTHASRLSVDPAGDVYLRWYPMVLLLSVGGGTSLLAIFVVPKFEQIFRDFHMQLPAPTIALLTFYRDWGPLVGLITSTLLVLMVAQLIAHLVLPGSGGLGPFRPLVRRLLWYTPLIGAGVRSRALADALQVIADSLSAGAPLAAAVRHAAHVPQSNPILQSRLERWADALEAGAPVGQAAARARLPRAVRGMMALAIQTSNLQMTLRFLARHYDSRHTRTQALLRGAAIPLISLLFGGIVLFVILALFLPLINLVNNIPGGLG